jgi:hypothetical protein
MDGFHGHNKPLCHTANSYTLLITLGIKPFGFSLGHVWSKITIEERSGCLETQYRYVNGKRSERLHQRRRVVDGCLPTPWLYASNSEEEN